MKSQKDYQLEKEVQKLARDSKAVKRPMPLEQRLERFEGFVTEICDVLLKMSLVPR